MKSNTGRLFKISEDEIVTQVVCVQRYITTLSIMKRKNYWINCQDDHYSVCLEWCAPSLETESDQLKTRSCFSL